MKTKADLLATLAQMDSVLCMIGESGYSGDGVVASEEAIKAHARGIVQLAWEFGMLNTEERDVQLSVWES